MLEENTGSTPSPPVQLPIESFRNDLSDDDADDNIPLSQLAISSEFIFQPSCNQSRNRKQRTEDNSINKLRLTIMGSAEVVMVEVLAEVELDEVVEV